MAEVLPERKGLRARIGAALRPKKSHKALRAKQSSETPAGGYRTLAEAKLNAPDKGFIDSQTGERLDTTAILHGLADRDDAEDYEEPHLREDGTLRPPGEPMVASLSSELWSRIVAYLTPTDAANLAFSSKTLFDRVGYGPWLALALPENRQYKIDFLVSMDQYLPAHLFCFACAQYHLRTQPGQEELKPTNVLNPLFNCPNASNPLTPPARARIAPGRTLPFTFVQLALRAHRYGPAHGIEIDDLNRRWRDRESGWSHHSRYQVTKQGHLLVRVVSTCFAQGGLPPSGLRRLLYCMEDDYNPYFSVCAHWRDGDLMKICKCALGHIPKAQNRGGLEGQLTRRMEQQGLRQCANPLAIVSLCGECQPMRRCPECPTEYMVEIRRAEDKNDPTQRFKQAITVTRWSDLGDGSSPDSPEWAACNGLVEYDSFQHIGRRAISGVFESHSTSEHIPGQRIMSLNPRNEKKGEAGNDWY
ncbi:uncharacterized protein K452DRAFT_350435 [Aplosporella prunicola CBS 121167]|uniref:F-box domain-containing protein n=1 Tax=Aplosporella prunicola CBS 121167 TaxID=1176127 RepID=A0A6A6BGX4_9PEZI|nr:uncharacterized protein K452DRAFT_350435 [Aplosporella prunicola CBS 121167]KAF2143402.1 hypothetical protein K452DRAFT_350435 [Aplosporella prunicola CBS 121167]